MTEDYYFSQVTSRVALRSRHQRKRRALIVSAAVMIATVCFAAAIALWMK